MAVLHYYPFTGVPQYTQNLAFSESLLPQFWQCPWGYLLAFACWIDVPQLKQNFAVGKSFVPQF